MTASEVAVAQSAEVDAILAAQAAEEDDEPISVPILKVGQSLTKEVQAEQAEAGEFINTLTNEGLGTQVELIVSFFNKGRFAADRDSGRAFVAFGAEIPPAWEDLVGESFVGTRFDEYPDAEEQYKIRVNNKEIEWGKGPLVSTTHNFTGLVIASPIEGEDDVPTVSPVRWSAKRTDVPAARKLRSLQRMYLRGKPSWDLTFVLKTTKKQFGQYGSYIVEVSKGRETTADEKAQAIDLAQAVIQQRVNTNEDGAVDSAPVAPDAEGGLGV